MNHSWHTLSSDNILRTLESTEQGLSKEEASRRIAVYGENRLPEAAVEGYPVIFLRQFASPLIYLLLAAAVHIPDRR